MSIYSLSGQELRSAYSVLGESLSDAYDIDGNEVLRRAFPLKVLQYNVGQWYIGNHDNIPADLDSIYYDLQNGIISAHNADVVLLEEYTAQFSKAGRSSLSWLSRYYPYYHEQTNGTTTTVTQRAIYSKYPITQYTTHAFHGYYYDSCYITINGVPIYFIVTHFHWNNTDNRSQEADIVLADMNNHEYVILGGDLNTVYNNDTDGVDYIGVIKKFIDAGYNVGNGGEFGFIGTHTSQSEEPYVFINLDNIITSNNITMNAFYPDTTKLTDDIHQYVDHLPVIAELTVR